MFNVSLVVQKPKPSSINIYAVTLDVNGADIYNGYKEYMYSKHTTLTSQTAKYNLTLEVYSNIFNHDRPINKEFISRNTSINISRSIGFITSKEIALSVEKVGFNYFEEMKANTTASGVGFQDIKYFVKYGTKFEFILPDIALIGSPVYKNGLIQNGKLSGLSNFNKNEIIPFTNGTITLIPYIGDNK
jgi:hypothetical protein